MTAKFKPYQYANCMIYSPKNQTVLKGFATVLRQLTRLQKDKLDGNKVTHGGIKYLVLVQNKKVYLVSDTNKARGTVFMKEI